MLTGVPGRGVSRDYLGGPQVIGGGQIKGVLTCTLIYRHGSQRCRSSMASARVSGSPRRHMAAVAGRAGSARGRLGAGAGV